MSLVEKPILVAFEGPIGCGKGTQTDLFKERREDVRVIGVSQAIRDLVRVDLRYSFALDVMSSGGLVPNDVVLRAVNLSIVMKGKMASPVTILDGIPRSVVQAKYLVEDISRFYELHLILLQLEDEKCVARAAERREKAMAEWAKYNFAPHMRPLSLRDDDEEEVVRERLRLYREVELDIKNYLFLNPSGISIHLLQADSHPEKIFQDISSLVFASQ
jgi:adenylate kinase